MNTSLVRWIDRIIGVPCCFAVSLLLRMAHAVAAFGDSKEPPRKILFLKPAEQGATVLAVPAFEEAAARLGAENVHVMVFQRNREIGYVFIIFAFFRHDCFLKLGYETE